MKSTTTLPTFAALVIAACFGACDQVKAKKPAYERKPAQATATRLAAMDRSTALPGQVTIGPLEA